jgi:hypothetical protein
MIQSFCDWLAATSISQLFADLSWFVPTVQTIHILAIAGVITLLSMLNFRVLRWTRNGPDPQTLAQTFLPWVWRTLIVLLVSGILLTVTEPARELMNNAFRIKMLLVLALVAVTLKLRSALWLRADVRDSVASRPILGKALAAVSLLLCVSIVVAGRLIAYI